ncbi:MAG: hypothetical protein DKT66_23190 [Candidatus Melainabacteria bacterium]|nr:MAG: hypothetical protein DKT66_23190 [Candidatus Melainabacteria bacterium]
MPSKVPLHIEDVIEPAPIKSVSLAKAFPQIAQMWDHKQNCGFAPDDFSYGSSVRAWFKCPKGRDHIFQKAISSITRAARFESAFSGCGFCKGDRASITNNLEKHYPKIAKEWMLRKNGIKPDQVSWGSNKMVWWKCPKGHEYEASVVNRTSNQSGCFKCNRGSPTDLRKYPKVLREFDFKRNKKVDPHALPVGQKVYWVCRKNKEHKWRSGFYRTKNQRCPYCTNKLGSKENNLAVSHSKLAKQWHPQKNKGKKATDFVSGSSFRAWWKCKKGPDHEWQATISDRVRSETGCPFCSFRKTSCTNVITAIAPKVAREWHPTKNGKIKPNQVRAHSRTNYWWLCAKCLHEYKAQAYSRTVRKTGCKNCSYKIGIQKMLKARGIKRKKKDIKLQPGKQ